MDAIKMSKETQKRFRTFLKATEIPKYKRIREVNDPLLERGKIVLNLQKSDNNKMVNFSIL